MLINVLLLSVSIASIALGLVIFLRNTKSKPNLYYGLFSMFLAVWAFGMWMYAKDPVDYNRILIWSKVLHFAGISVATFLLLFAIDFTENKFASNIYLKAIITSPLIFLSLLTLASDKVINSLNLIANNRQIIYGYGYVPYFGMFVIYMVITIVLLSRKYFSSKGILKQQLKYICLGIGIPSSLALVINIILPAFGNFRIAWLGPVLIFAVIASIGYAITKHHLFEIKVIVTEISVIILLLAALFDLLTSEGPVQGIIRLTAMIIILFGGFLLVKSVKTEIKQKTDLEILSTELKEANNHLKELDETKDNFLSMASHELNTPISAIEGYLSMIIDEKMCGELDPKLQEYLKNVYNSSRRLAALVRDLLNVSRIESNRIHIVYTQEQIDDVIDEAIKEIGIKAKERGHELIFAKHDPPLPLTYLDRPRILEIIINLLGNAVKYTEPGGKIIVEAHTDGDKLVVSVKDNGRGIPEDKREHMFEKFVQVDVFKDEVKGTGLGMFISKNLVRMHKGDLWFTSSVHPEDHGSTFYFSLPILAEKPADKFEGQGAVLQLK